MDKEAVIAWLEQIKKLDELIRAKEDDIADIIERATKITASLDGMPHCGGKSDKVGDGAVKLAEMDSAELDSLKQQRQYIIDTIKLLPADEFGVLRREFVRGMTKEQIAFAMNYGLSTIRRRRENALRLLGEILEKKGDRF